MEPILAFIMPLSTGGLPTHPIAPGGPTPTPPIYYPPQQPPGIWPSPGVPTHPIAPGGPPPGIWPSPGVPTHPIAPGGQPPYPSQGPGFPANPIYIPVQPPPDSGLAPEHPIYFPVYPDHPIANVPTWQDIKDFIFGNPPPARPHPETPSVP
jgi:hypothetical protein